MLTIPLSLLRRLVDPDGGFTWHPRTGEMPTRGYAVAILPDIEMVFSPVAAQHDGVARFIHANWRHLQDERHFVGAWHNPVSGLIHVDISIVVSTEQEAEALCRRFRQLAYYDFTAGRSVEVAEHEIEAVA
jgi:hypothetical protein